MFSKKLMILFSMYFTIQPLYGYSLSWNRVNDINKIAYYSDDGNGYYRKVSQDELVQQKLPKIYIVSDRSGYYYQYETQHGGGGSYSFQPQKEMENNNTSYVQIGQIALYEKAPLKKQEEKFKYDLSFGENYPIYMD